MQDKKIPTSHLSKQTANKPLHDPVTRGNAVNFPAVGMTLNSYKHSPFSAPSSGGTNAAAPVLKSERSKVLRKFTIKRLVILLLVVFLVAGIWTGGKFVYNIQKIFGGNILSVLSSTKLKGEETGRVTILLAGNSADDIGHDGAELTDSIMLLSVDTKNKRAYMLSVPRDLWVDIGDEGYSKINYAYVAGESEEFSKRGYPKGGMGLLESVLERNLGIDINYYALVNYRALKDAVDAVGGIDFTVSSVDKRGLYDPNIDYSTNKPLVKLTNGKHHLNGQQALNLSRARGDSFYAYGFPRGDFDRTENQRKLLLALKVKTVSAGVLANPTKLSSLSDALGNNVKTDFTVSEVRRLYDIVKDIKNENVSSVGLNSANGKNLLESYLSSNGQSALVPAAGLDDYSEIRSHLRQITSSDPTVREGASLVILNGTSTPGLASKQRVRLEAKNYTVLQVGDADEQALTTIIDVSRGKKPGTVAALKKLYPKATVATTSPYARFYAADIIVILGAEQVPPPPSAAPTPSAR